MGFFDLNLPKMVLCLVCETGKDVVLLIHDSNTQLNYPTSSQEIYQFYDTFIG